MGPLAPWDPEGLTAWAEGAVEAFQRINGPLPAAHGQTALPTHEPPVTHL